MIKVFVYGSLKKGLDNFHVLETSTFIGRALVNGVLYDLGFFPGMVPGNQCVEGEVYEVSPETLLRLDLLEGFREDRDPAANFYNRKTVRVCVEGKNRFLQAEAYFYNREIDDNCALIENGIFKKEGSG